MGGKDGARGYLYQAIVSLLNSLNDENWKFVQLEPDTDHDKVDIAWEYENHHLKVVQVKSSINNISRAEIIRWFNELIGDVKNADEYQLILIGTCSDNTKAFITKVNKKGRFDGEELKELGALGQHLSKVSIQLENFDPEGLDAKIERSLNRFLTVQGYTLNHFTIEMIVEGLKSQFLKFSTQGTKVSRDDLVEELMNWVYYNYPDVHGRGKTKKNLLVQFYLSGDKDFSVQFQRTNLDVLKSGDFLNKQQEVIALAEKIDKIKLPPKVEKTEEVDSNDPFAQIRKMLGVGAMGLYASAETPDPVKEEYIQKAKKLVNLSLQKSFFFVGELKKQIVTVNSPFAPKPDIQGTDEEKEKGELIKSFLYKLDYLEELSTYFSYLDQFLVVPLILSNEGHQAHEDITVNLTFPKNVEIVTDSSIRLPDFLVIKDFTGYDGILNKILRHHKDSKVMDNSNGLFHPLPQVAGLSAFRDAEEIVEEKVRHFKWYVSCLFNFEAFVEEEGTVLQYHFDKLNPSNRISFPSYLLVKADQDFKIGYEITSQQLSRAVKGELTYRVQG